MVLQPLTHNIDIPSIYDPSNARRVDVPGRNYRPVHQHLVFPLRASPTCASYTYPDPEPRSYHDGYGNNIFPTGKISHQIETNKMTYRRINALTIIVAIFIKIPIFLGIIKLNTTTLYD